MQEFLGQTYYGNVFRRVTAQADINLRILKDFTAEGLDFSFPTQTILASVEQKSV